MNQPLNLGLTPSLRVRPDMPAQWVNCDLDFDTAADRLIAAHHHDGEARDQPATDLRTWAVTNSAGELALAPLAGHSAARPLRSTAFSHLCARVGAPVEFIRDRLPAELQLGLMNYLLASAERPLPSQLRLRGDEVSAVVSDRYAPLDAEEFVESVRGALVQHGVLREVRVRSLATGPTDALRLILPGERAELKVGDVSHVGLDVVTSSFGKSAVHISGVLWRLVCTNGLRTPSQMGHFSYRHVGDTQRLREGLQDAVPTALIHARGFMGQWQRSMGQYIDHVADTIQAMRELTLGERELVTEALKQEVAVPELPERTSAFDLVNAITLAAHGVEPARRLELESFAGEFLRRQVRAS